MTTTYRAPSLVSETLGGSAGRKSWSFVYAGCGANANTMGSGSLPAVPAFRDSCAGYGNVDGPYGSTPQYGMVYQWPFFDRYRI